MKKFPLRTRFARRFPDPVLNEGDRHIFLCDVLSVPPGMPEANVRPQNINKRIYREVAKHLRNENDEGSRNVFHLMNKGITVLASEVNKRDEDTYDLVFTSESQGIVDGGHTYKIICENQKKISEKNQQIREDRSLSEGECERLLVRQYVKIEILTGFNASMTTEIARGLNTAVQVQEQTLATHAGKFNWIREHLQDERYLEKIEFRENEDGLLDIADLIRIMELFNIRQYPHDGAKHPIRAYTGKENVLSSFLRDDGPFRQLQPLLKEILILHDRISSEARDKWNKEKPKGRGASLAFIDSAPDDEEFEFPFIYKTGKHRLYRGVLFPILAAFRWMVVEEKSTGVMRWRGSFDEVLSLWDELAIKLLEATRETSDELGRKPDAVGKSSNHWKNLFNVVAFHQAVTMSQRA